MALPVTPLRPVVDKYHGIPVEDPYRWLEEPASEEVRAWVQAQNEVSRAYLDQIPFREKLYQAIYRLQTAISPGYGGMYYTPGQLFSLKRQPPLQQLLLVCLASPDDPASEKVILDPNQLDPTGGTAIDFFVPSHDGRLVAVSLSQGGSEEGTVSVVETATGRMLADRIPRVTYPTGGGSLAWDGQASGFFYTRYPRGSERPAEDFNFYQQVYYHRLGEDTGQDAYVIGDEFPRIAETRLETSKDGRCLLAEVSNGDGGEVAHYLRGPDERWTQVTRYADEVKFAALGEDGFLYMLSRKDAPLGRIIRLPLDRPALADAQVLVTAESLDPAGAGRPGAIDAFLPAARYLYVIQQDGGPSKLFAFDMRTQRAVEVPTEPVSAIYEVVKLEGDEILFRSGSFLAPPAWFRYTPEDITAQGSGAQGSGAQGAAARTALFVTSPADFSDIEVVRAFAVSKDGTRVPLNILRKKGLALDGQNPTLLYGYGGYGVSLSPNCSTNLRVWFDAGGLYALANLRGGGEYGEDWHAAGSLTNKQNVFDDFIACADYLMRQGYTSPEKLCIQGGSNGGLLMGAVLTQRPDLFRAAAAQVGIYDMLRVELDPNGAFNVTEFGTVTNPQHFEALYDYSPYHHVQAGTAYPAVLLTSGENDGRVNPAHSRKMTARMQAATGSGRPVLLRASLNTGHGMGTPLEEQINEAADLYAFLMAQVGMQP